MKCLPAIGVFLILSAACTRVQPGPSPRAPQTRDQYDEQLRHSQLSRTPDYREWTGTAHDALRIPLTIRPSFQEILSFPSDRATAIAYRLQLRRGQSVHVTVQRENGAGVFAEMFEEIGPGAPIFRLVKTVSGYAAEFDFEAHMDGPHVLRLQPPLMKGAAITVTVTTAASLTFPVLGKTSGHIGSFFGDQRDGGRRHHEGIDIFAKAGTPVIAAAAGVITQVTTTSIGGNVVWQEDPLRNVSYYYAHLRTQSVTPGQRVQAGDEIGTVGNTGNAQATASHLHFAVYKPGRVAVDPVPFLFKQPSEPLLVHTRDLGADYSTKASH